MVDIGVAVLRYVDAACKRRFQGARGNLSVKKRDRLPEGSVQSSSMSMHGAAIALASNGSSSYREEVGRGLGRCVGQKSGDNLGPSPKGGVATF